MSPTQTTLHPEKIARSLRPHVSLRGRTSTHVNPLALWHLLSLDAPTVAALWLLFVARATHVALPPALAPAMFLAVWLVYVSDRLLDVRGLPMQHPAVPAPAVSSHHFHRRHHAAFATAALCATVLLAALLPTLPTHLLGRYLLLAAVLFVWFSLIHFTPLTLPKTLAPGCFFAAAIFTPVLSQGQLTRHNALALAAFALLCLANCLLIRRWSQAPSTDVPLRTLALALALSPLLEATPITLAVALAALSLLALDHWHSRLKPMTLRAAADLALLTPLLLYPYLK